VTGSELFSDCFQRRSIFFNKLNTYFDFAIQYYLDNKKQQAIPRKYQTEESVKASTQLLLIFVNKKRDVPTQMGEKLS
jgi:hypothetical protein